MFCLELESLEGLERLEPITIHLPQRNESYTLIRVIQSQNRAEPRSSFGGVGMLRLLGLTGKRFGM
jgi:hypothetical protein